MSAAVRFDIEEVKLVSLIPRFPYDGSIGIHRELSAAGAITNRTGVRPYVIANFEAAHHFFKFFVVQFDFLLSSICCLLLLLCQLIRWRCREGITNLGFLKNIIPDASILCNIIFKWKEPVSFETGSSGRGTRTRTQNKGFGDPRLYTMLYFVVFHCTTYWFDWTPSISCKHATTLRSFVSGQLR